MAVLEIRNLEKTYKKGFFPKPHKALFNVSFKVKEGRVTGFLGGNGAGKTTTMKCFLGLIFPDSGDITYFNGLHLGEEVKARIGFLPERPYFYEYLTGIEFLSFYGRLSTKLSRNDLKERSEKLLKRVDLWHAKDKKLHEYSKGMLQKIGIAQALVHDPEFVILDEPMSGLDPDGRYYVNEIIRETAREGKAVFFSSHLLPDAEKLCEDLVILRGGKVVYEGSTEAFLHTMGEAAIISYFFRGEKKSRRVETDQELQQVLHQLISEGATVVDVKRDRNLEDAFIKIGLRGPEV